MPKVVEMTIRDLKAPAEAYVAAQSDHPIRN